jgi:phage FluMu protein Com
MKCDTCSKSFSVSDEKAGKRVRCPGCKEVLTVPSDDEEEFEPTPAPRARKAAGQKKKKAAKSQMPWLLIGIGGGVLVVVIVVGFLLMRGPDKPAEVAQPAPPNGAVPAMPNTNAATPSAVTAPGTSPANPPAVPSTSANVAWTVKADPVPQPIEWPEGWKAKVDVIGSASEVLFPTSLSPFAMDVETGAEVRGGQVWNLTTGQKLYAFNGKTGPLSPPERRLSPDAKYLLGKVVDKENNSKLEVWSLETSQLVRQISADVAGMNLAFADFLPGDRLVTITTGKQGDKNAPHRLRVFKLSSGEPLLSSGDDNLLEPRAAVFSHGRRYLASYSRVLQGELVIYDTQSGQLVAKKPMSGKGTDSIYAVGFSPLGDKIAVAMGGYNVCRIVVLDAATGNEVQEHRYPASFRNFVPGLLYTGPTIDWFPDSSGLLLGGTVAVDLVSGRSVWALFTAPNQYNLDNANRRLPIPGGFLTISGKLNKAKFTLLPFDAKLQSLAQSLSTNNSLDALFKPSQKVSLEVKVEKLLFGTPEETKKTLEGTYREILEAAGFEVADSQSVVFKVSYNEAAAGKFDSFMRGPTGGATPSVEGTKALLNLEWATNQNESL